ncbi:hypothetical protein SAMN04487926_101480 [Paraburkholderia steynii]|uniref:Uncharacterized protein n=2 Tax=Paraburkholderia steynii TaxID=1245441 RepID=A0A7Z7B0C8_9BURK|nr:hypothetical protein SAMN04487926_101480 [Paraburkholderia steynii]
MPSPSRSRLPRDIQNALELIDHAGAAIDRLKFSIDHPEPNLPAPLMKHRIPLEVARNGARKYHPVWQSKFDLLQPTIGQLRAYVNAIGPRYRVALNEIELNLDWMTGTAEAAMQLRDFVLARLLVPHLRDPVNVFNQTVYFGPRADGNGHKRPQNFVTYADKPSKLNGQPCCHLEWRFCGPAALGDIGLFSLDDCIAFDHRGFWAERLRLFALPSKADIGRWLNADNLGVSPTALTKRADRFLDPYRQDGGFILHNCRIEHRDIDAILKPVDNTLFLPQG